MTRRHEPETASARANVSARVRSRVAVAAGVVGIALVITGCTPQPAPTSTASPSASSTPGGTAPTAEPTLIPGGTAEQNRPFFDKVNNATLAANPDAKGRDFIDGLAAAGFTKADMQVTADMTTINLKANSIQFSVRMGETCLIGQRGVDWEGYNSVVTPMLATGGCLIGQTRAIDW